MAGTLTVAAADIGGAITRYTLTWASDASGNVSGTVDVIRGRLIEVRQIPNGGGTQPTDLYDMTIVDGNSVDLLVGGGANISNAAASYITPLLIANGYPVFTEAGTLTLAISNAGNAKGGQTVLYVCAADELVTAGPTGPTGPTGAAGALVLLSPTLATDGIGTTLDWTGLSGYDIYMLVLWGVGFTDNDGDGPVIQFGNSGVLDTTAGNYKHNTSSSNVGGIDIPDVDLTGCFVPIYISNARSSAGNKLVLVPASVLTPAAPTRGLPIVGSWLGAGAITDLRLVLDSASPTPFPVGGFATLYGLAT